MYRILILLFLFVLLFTVGADEFTLMGLMENLPATCAEYRKSALELARALAGYKEERASLLPALSFTVPFSFNNNPRTPVSGLETDVVLEDSQQIGLSPELMLSQYLPTAGTLGISLTGDFSINNIGGVSPESFASSYDLDPTYEYTSSLSLTLSQPLVFADVYGATVSQVKETWEIAHSNYIITGNMIIYGLCESYSNLIYLQNNIRLLGAKLENVQSSYIEAQQNFELGQLARLMLQKVEAELKKGQLDLRGAEGAYYQALDTFCRTYSVDREEFGTFLASAGVDLAAQLEAINLPPPETYATRVTEKALKSNIQLVIARKQLELARAGVSQAKAMEAPLLNLGTGFNFGSVEESYDNAADAFRGPFSDDGNAAFFISLSISGDIFDGGASSHRVAQAESLAEQSFLNLSLKEEEIKRGAEILLDKLQRVRENLEYMQLNLEIEKFEYEKGLQDFKRGLISHNGLFALKLKYETAVLDVLKPEMEYTLTQLELLMFMGDDLRMLIQEDVNDE